MRTHFFRSPVTIATIASILILNLALLVLGRSIKHQEEAWQWLVHTREVLEHLQTTLTLANEAEGAQRGYLLTGKEEYLAVYNQARQSIPPTIGTLRSLTADNPTQQNSLKTLETLLTDRILRLQQVLDRRTRGEPLDLASVESGRLSKQQTLLQANKIRDEEQRLLAERQQEVDEARKELILAVTIVATVSILLLVLLWIISERDAARLRSERAQLDATLRSIGEGVIATDVQGRIRLMNAAAERLAGVSEADAAGRSLEQAIRIIDGTTRQPVELPLAEVVRSASAASLQGDNMLLSTTGAERNIEVSLAPIKPGTSDMEGVVLVLNDVTQRHLREQELAESEANYRYTIELNPQVPWKAAADGMITGFSPRWLQLTGLRGEAPMESGLTRVINPADFEHVTRQWSHSLATGEPFDVEHRVRSADGSDSWMRSRANARRDEQGRVIAWYGLTEDIHARKESELALIHREAELRAKLAQLETIYSAVPVGLGYVDVKMRLVELNDALAEINGLPKEVQIGRCPGDILPLRLGRELTAIYAAVLQEKKPVTGIEFQAGAKEHTDGRRDWLASFYPVIEEGEVQGIVAAVLEVTQIKDAQRKLLETNQHLEQRILERTEQIAEANAELRAFAHTVAHDLRAPLRNIEGFSAALIEDEADRLSEEGKNYANRIGAAVVRLDRLITDLLAYSRLSRIEIRLETVHLQTVLQIALRDLETQIGETGARIDIDDALPDVLGNRAVLAQITQNLLSNAIKFVAPGVAPRIRVSGATVGSMARLQFQDNGIGISPEHQERIFGVFERLHGQEQYPGTGIGLAIVRKGIERMGGSIAVSSRTDAPNAGTTFELTLPAAPNLG
jgi:PAS domain S-box-containing protein